MNCWPSWLHVFNFDFPLLVRADISGDMIERFLCLRLMSLGFIIQKVQLGQSPRVTFVKHMQESGSVFKGEALFMYTLCNLFLKSARMKGPVEILGALGENPKIFNHQFICCLKIHTSHFQTFVFLGLYLYFVVNSTNLELETFEYSQKGN